MIGLTHRQQQALDYIHDYIAARGIPPSFDEISDGAGIGTKSGVFRIVNALVERGHIRRMPGRARSIELVEHSCPHCGGRLA